MEMNINIEEYLKNLKINYPKSLFEPNFNLLNQSRCPICTRKLYWNLDRTIARCKSKQKDRFFITREKFDRLKFMFN